MSSADGDVLLAELLSMGFDASQARTALEATDYASVDAAVDLIIASGGLDGDGSGGARTTQATSAPPAPIANSGAFLASSGRDAGEVDYDSFDEENYSYGSDFSNEDGDGRDGGGVVATFVERDTPDELIMQGSRHDRVLEGSEIREQLFKEIEHAASTFELPLTTAGALMRHCRWDYERFSVEYSSDPSAMLEAAGVHVARRSHAPVVALGADAEVECEVCMDDFRPAAGTVMACGHKFCNNCWVDHIRAAVAGGVALGITCMDKGCNELVDEAMVRALMSGAAQSATLAKWCKIVADSFVAEHPYIRWCPGKDCTKAIHCESLATTVVRCSCGCAFCFKCMHEAHDPATCGEERAWAKKAKDDSETANWIHVNTKDCPKCHSAIEKNGGCQHMTCKSCRHEFCWHCFHDWRTHKACNGAPTDDTATTAARTSLQQYLHYWLRFKEHENSQQAEEQLREAALVKMIALQAESGTVCFGGDVSYIDKATEQLIECRRTLKHTYVKAYYLHAAAAAAKGRARSGERYVEAQELLLFEFLQAELERTTEDLSHLLEQEYWKLDAAKINDHRVAASKKLDALLRGARDGFVTDVGLRSQAGRELHTALTDKAAAGSGAGSYGVSGRGRSGAAAGAGAGGGRGRSRVGTGGGRGAKRGGRRRK